MLKKSDFDSIFRENYPQLLYFTGQYVNDEEACRDIVSMAFEKLWKNFSKVEPDCAKSFLYVTVRHSCVDYARHQLHHREYARYVAASGGYVADSSAIMETKERQAHAYRFLNSLKSPTRDIFIACYVDRKKYCEVAAEMGISISTVKKHIVKVLKILRNDKAF